MLGVEDDNASYFLIKTVLEHVGAGFELRRAVDGEQALAFLRQRGPYVNAPRPDLILLNLNMPRVGGLEMLEVIQQDESRRQIPRVVLASSRLDSERARCITLGAKQFISKPNDYEVLQAVRQACSNVSVFS